MVDKNKYFLQLLIFCFYIWISLARDNYRNYYWRILAIPRTISGQKLAFEALKELVLLAELLIFVQ